MVGWIEDGLWVRTAGVFDPDAVRMPASRRWGNRTGDWCPVGCGARMESGVRCLGREKG